MPFIYYISFFFRLNFILSILLFIQDFVFYFFTFIACFFVFCFKEALIKMHSFKKFKMAWHYSFCNRFGYEISDEDKLIEE